MIPKIERENIVNETFQQIRSDFDSIQAELYKSHVLPFPLHFIFFCRPEDRSSPRRQFLSFISFAGVSCFPFSHLAFSHFFRNWFFPLALEKDNLRKKSLTRNSENNLTIAASRFSGKQDSASFILFFIFFCEWETRQRNEVLETKTGDFRAGCITITFEELGLRQIMLK